MAELAEVRAQLALVDRAIARTEAMVSEIKETMRERTDWFDGVEERLRAVENARASAAGAAAVKRTLHGTVSGLIGGLMAGLGTVLFTGHH